MVEEMKEKYAGQGYRDDWNGDWSENHMFNFVRMTTGKIIFDNPKVRVKTRRPGSQRLIAQAMQHALNRWIRDVQLRKLLKRTYVDQLFAFSVVQTVFEPQPGEDPRDPSVYHWPQAYNLLQDRFIFDPLCAWFGAARYVGHKWVRDKEDLIREAEENPQAGWDLDAIQAIAEGTGIDDLPERQDRRSQNLTREEMVCYDLWVPEISTESPEDGFHGTIYTLAVGGNSQSRVSGEEDSTGTQVEYIREPRAYYGPRWGPYTMFGVYPMPGDPYPLSPFAATYRQNLELNQIVRAANDAIREYKKVIFVSADNPDLARKIKDSPNSMVVLIKGFDKNQVAVEEYGGITDQHLKQIEQALQRADRNIGVHEVQRGGVGSAKFATEIAQANQAQEESISFIKQEFTDATTQILNTAGWGMYHDDRTVFPIGGDEAEQMGFIEPWFYGGAHNDGSGARYDDLEMEIEPYSMERMNEALMRAQYSEMMALAIEAATVIPVTPFYDWKRLFDKGGEVLNDPAFGEFYNQDIASAVQGMAMQQNVQEPRAEFSKQQGGGQPSKGSTSSPSSLQGGLTKKTGV